MAVHSVPIAFVAAGAGDNVIIAGVPGRRIEVLGYVVSVSAAVVIKFQDTAGSPVALSGSMSLGASGVQRYPGNKDAIAFRTDVGMGVEINVSAAVTAGGHITYRLVT